MATTRKKRRRRSSTSSTTSTQAASSLQLPAFPIPEHDGADAEAARAALSAAESPDGSAAPDHSDAGDDAGATGAAETALSDHADSTRDRSPAPPSPAPAPARKPEARALPLPKPPKGADLSGKRYKGLKLEQLRTAIAMRDAEVEQLREKVAQTAPLVEAATDEALSNACGETIAMIGDVAAMFYGETARLTTEQKRKLGDVWAPAIRPYLGGAAAHMPLVAAVSTTAGIVFEKYWTIRAEQETKRSAPAATPAAALPASK